jgi:hypothetical protein
MHSFDDPGAVTYKAAAALPYDDRERAVAVLRGQLRLMAIAGGIMPDWSTLEVAGPTEPPGLRRAGWFEWHASVRTHDGQLLEEPTDGWARPDRSADETAPFACVTDTGGPQRQESPGRGTGHGLRGALTRGTVGPGGSRCPATRGPLAEEERTRKS